MEYLILGLLILSPMTGYELQKFIKKNLSLICSHSAGSVQTSLYKLEKDGKITAEETVEGRRRKKTFSITEDGRTAFRHTELYFSDGEYQINSLRNPGIFSPHQ